MSDGKVEILFTGYAPVHFVCFRPIFAALAVDPKFGVHVSGGLERKTENGISYDTPGLYDRFALPPAVVLSMDEIADRSFDLLFSACTRKIVPRSVSRCVQIFHGMSIRNRAVRTEATGYDDYFVLGPFQRRLFETLCILPADDPKLHSIGFPKTDVLVDGSIDRERVISQHGFRGDRPVVLYAPTGAIGNSLETLGCRLIRAIAAMASVDLLVKPHDHPKDGVDWFDRLAPLENDHVRLIRDPDIVPYLATADLLVTDASSTANEFTLRDRPIVYIDVPELLARAAAEDGRLDLATWGRRGGTVVSTPAEAVAAIDAGLSDPSLGSQVRRAIRDDLFYNPGAATCAAVDWIAELAVS